MSEIPITLLILAIVILYPVHGGNFAFFQTQGLTQSMAHLYRAAD